ncbi:N-acetylneuraminate synthase family protein [Verminephrobacter eiseniae]|uniref:N-acetylneuraminate synthase n=1 Tax=Verminephrobacter eiseniae (strain EF01-2) TaxID=391735 RepID=A1WSD6_VEREI|nr:N-acetylneuraminate synthase family protein [Verminephrobacter eiseniae]ABM60543.1 N-acetylneuraminate synthase [Verminephrobacter eiseniae EF01-2]MCW5286019.1 N-acylneuraminate-9-phosphate synthase [Verminephrobacter eiseniae]MCW5304317.1 N-acylneuraminate-9-phosphate synthase [Verminephrobacter eiseniae]MCW8180511.1 N-acylneuraminate-9-phosphate synthase [Verminephrobacter eiseniae]MCW8190257.1 N-acylneuraminate-9-phosphate synthase [Verminephrobacter eiseniae]
MDFISKQFGFQPGERCIVIGEIGVNHNRQQDMLFRLIDEGIAAGLDVIKLQRFKAEQEIAMQAPAADYQKRAGAGESQLQMARQLELPDAWLTQAFDYCRQRGVGFLCTAFDHGSVDFLADRLGCKTVKIPSPEVSNKPLLQHMARRFDGLLLSTGASYLGEVANAIDWLAAEAGPRELALMHCLSEYPAPVEQANLRAMASMRAAFKVPVGYSDHTPGQVAAVVAVGLGAAMIEKHYTLDKNLPGPDHQASLDIPELRAFVTAVRQASASLGDGIKRPAPAEIDNRPLIRKSVVCAVPAIEAGTAVTAAMLGVKRPWTRGAVEPFEIEKILGLSLRHDKQYDEAILWSDFR